MSEPITLTEVCVAIGNAAAMPEAAANIKRVIVGLQEEREKLTNDIAEAAAELDGKDHQIAELQSELAQVREELFLAQRNQRPTLV